MRCRLIRKIIVILLVPTAMIAAALAATSTGVLSQQIPGEDAAGKPNTTCVYFFMRTLGNDAMATDTVCPRTIKLKDILNEEPATVSAGEDDAATHPQLRQ